jgi:hypothetical protein
MYVGRSFKPLPKQVPPRELWQQLFRDETVGSIPNLNEQLPDGWNICTGPRSPSKRRFGQAPELARYTATNAEDWVLLSRKASPGTPYGKDGFEFEYHFFYNEVTGQVFDHYFKQRRSRPFTDNGEELSPTQFEPMD